MPSFSSKNEVGLDGSFAQLPVSEPPEPTGRTKKILRRVLRYYSKVETPKNLPRSIDDIRLFFGLVKCRPWIIIVSGIIAQFLYGSLYSWSIFNDPINERIYGNADANMAQITFYIALGFMGTTAAAAGPWIESHHPRITTLIGCLLFFSGHLLSGLATYFNRIGLLYFGYGVVSGMGLGIGYVSTIDVVTKWFPKTRGLASGIAVAGFGAGSTAFSSIDRELIEKFGLPGTFFFLGMIMLVVQATSSQFMSFPPIGWNTNGVVVVGHNETLTARGRENIGQVLGHNRDIHQPEQTTTYLQLFDNERPVINITLASALGSRDFWLLYFGFLANELMGVVFISNLATMIQALFNSNGRTSELTPTTVVTIEAAFNMGGRMIMGFFSDRLGRKTAFLTLIGVQIIIISLIPHSILNRVFWEFCAFVWIATWCYGGGFGMIPAFLADMFGVNNTSSCHGIFLTAWSLGAIGGGLLYNGITRRLTNSGRKSSDPYIYNVNLYWILGIVVLGFVLTLFVRATARDRLFPAAPGQIMRIRIFGRIFRLTRVVNSIDPHRPTAPHVDMSMQESNKKRWFPKLKFEMLSSEQEQSLWEEYLLLRAIQSRLRGNMV
ncbi:hypothetical protein H4219_000998 [Mycoemilia scoparia]|uniref:Major facilitator superfamily (MFS) profile domain-containing protein n=1 Tax=Mycoemilia scoparia TaxID=417184 RepID=A0A9W8A1F6_9FUNG|nr:hypothetical protein H4219_000998 [Mycoemilia scoparia]